MEHIHTTIPENALSNTVIEYKSLPSGYFYPLETDSRY